MTWLKDGKVISTSLTRGRTESLAYAAALMLLRPWRAKRPSTLASFAAVSLQPSVAMNFWAVERHRAVCSVKMTVAVDAKDVHDKGNSDTASYGSQKSLAFTVAWLRAVLSKPHTALKWTATENMWVDGGTKMMDLTHTHTCVQ